MQIEQDESNPETRYFVELFRGNAFWEEDFASFRERSGHIREAVRDGCSVLRTWTEPHRTPCGEEHSPSPPQLFLAGHAHRCGQSVMRLHQSCDCVRFYADTATAQRVVERFNRMTTRRASAASSS